MTSKRRVEANRNNAKASTGPKSAAGKQRASHNSYRHGLTLSAATDPKMAEAIKQLARKIVAAGGARDEVSAGAIAETQMDLLRVREARRVLLHPDHPDALETRPPRFTGAGLIAWAEEEWGALPGYPRRVMRQAIAEMFPSRPKSAAHLLQLYKRLGALDRYERAALARRNKSIRTTIAAAAGAN